MIRAVATDITKHKQAEERLRILAEAGRTLDTSLDYETTLANVTSIIVPALADDCIIFLQSDLGRLEMVTSAHSDPARADGRPRIFSPLPEPREIRAAAASGSSHRAVGPASRMRSSDIEEPLALSREQYEASIGARVSAGLAVPLRSRGQILGVMVWVCVESGRRYGQEDLKLAEEIANRAAIAVDNARLFKAAQDGVAARDRFLAMLGHELRNPLNSISIVARMLERESLSDERLTKLRTMIGRETRQLSAAGGRSARCVTRAGGQDEPRVEPVDLDSAGARERAILRGDGAAAWTETRGRDSRGPIVIVGDRSGCVR